jgi:hypothetical protein
MLLLDSSAWASAHLPFLGQVLSKFCRLPQGVKRGLFNGHDLPCRLGPSG